MSDRLRIAFVVGHNNVAKGKKGFQSLPEYSFHKELASKYLNKHDVYFHDGSITSYVKRCQDLGWRIDANGKYDLIIALHFNAYEDDDVSGAEAFHYIKSLKGRYYAKYYTNLITRNFKTRNRGPKSLFSKKQRGYRELVMSKSTTILVEPFFATNKEESDKFTIENYGQFLQDFICEINMNGKY